MNETQLLNEALFEAFATPGMEKKAADSVNEFTRTRMREDGFFRKILPFQTITDDQLDRRLDTDKPYKIVDKEPDSPAAMSIGFGTLPLNMYIRGSRYPVSFDRVTTNRYVKDVDELRTYHMDIRQVLSDNSIKDMLAEEDGKFLVAVDACLIGPDVTVPQSGVSQWRTLHGGITRETLQDAFKIMPQTPSHLEVNTVLINNVTIREILKFGREEVGGDKAQDLLVNGWSDTEFMRAKWIVTIKRDLVADDSMYMFAHEKFVGKAFELCPTTMYVKREAFMIEFFSYETIGGSLGHTGGLARADFD